MRMRYGVELADQLGNLLSRCLSKSLNQEMSLPDYQDEYITVYVTNQYITNSKPWILAKSNRQKSETVIYHCLEAFRVFGILLQPIMPGTMHRMLDKIT